LGGDKKRKVQVFYSHKWNDSFTSKVVYNINKYETYTT
jgi:hypothetical protein